MAEGIIFDIKKFATHDGPGIRTTVFLKGCPLDCIWCHNPESKMMTIEKNVSGGHRDDKNVGRKISVDTLFKEIQKDEIFYEESGGGVTFSGGEALLQEDFLVEILKRCRTHGIHTAIDTAGYCSKTALKKVLPFTDLFLYDIKLMDNSRHQQYTGKPNLSILENFEYLMAENATVEVRIPLIPGITDTRKNLTAINAFLAPYKSQITIELIPYNKLGESKLEKYSKRNAVQKMAPQSKERLRILNKIFK